MRRGSEFRATLTALWFRLITLAIVGLVFAEALYLAPGKAQGWTYYLTVPEVLFEVVVRLIAAALAGIAVGTLCTVVAAPFLWHFRSSRERVADVTTKIAVVVVVFVLSIFALEVLINWSHFLSVRGDRFKAALVVAYVLAFVLALIIPRTRKEVVTSLDGFLSDRMTRRTALATVLGTAAVVATEFAFTKSVPSVKATQGAKPGGSNLLLITFDALSAEDISLYGYKLATTPNLDAFARKSTVFTNFYSGSTFTSPCIATMVSGLYPSESHVYQMQGRVRATKDWMSLPSAMRKAGYSTGAFLCNSNAYYLAQSLESGYESLPEPTYQAGGLQYLWDATTPLHQNSGIGNRLDEYIDLMRVWNTIGRLPENLYVRYPAAASFEHAREMLAKVPDGFFLWVHVMTPHSPYLPEAAERGRFMPADEKLAYENEDKTSWKPHYMEDQQYLVGRCRLRYDEFVATADREFGTFMSELENSGRLANTTVIVSADHGESFEGGVFQHESPYLTRPIIHIPLLIRMPGQQEPRTVPYTADQTALAPTILELAGASKPDGMHGQSLAAWLSPDGSKRGQGVWRSANICKETASLNL